MSDETAYVVMLGGRPLAAATTLDAAKDDAEEAEVEYRTGETRWDEHRPGEWRLMRRAEGRGRFSWSQYWVAEVPNLAAVAAPADVGQADARAAALAEASAAARGEYLTDSTGTPEDKAYQQAVGDVICAIDKLRDAPGGRRG